MIRLMGVLDNAPFEKDVRISRLGRATEWVESANAKRTTDNVAYYEYWIASLPSIITACSQ